MSVPLVQRSSGDHVSHGICVLVMSVTTRRHYEGGKTRRSRKATVENDNCFLCENCDFCTRKHRNTGATIGPHTPLVSPNRCPLRRAALALPREHPPPSRLYPPATWPWRAVLSSVGVRATCMGDVQISYTTSIGLRAPSRAGLARSFPV